MVAFGLICLAKTSTNMLCTIALTLIPPPNSQLLAAAASSIVSGVDTGYAGSNGLEPQQFGSDNSPCGYICYGFGEFDGQGSGHAPGNVRFPRP
jgi:hypothetical protein